MGTHTHTPCPKYHLAPLLYLSVTLHLTLSCSQPLSLSGSPSLSLSDSPGSSSLSGLSQAPRLSLSLSLSGLSVSPQHSIWYSAKMGTLTSQLTQMQLQQINTYTHTLSQKCKITRPLYNIRTNSQSHTLCQCKLHTISPLMLMQLPTLTSNANPNYSPSHIKCRCNLLT